MFIVVRILWHLFCLSVCRDIGQDGGVRKCRHSGVPLRPRWQLLLPGAQPPPAGGAPLHWDGRRRQPPRCSASGECLPPFVLLEQIFACGCNVEEGRFKRASGTTVSPEKQCPRHHAGRSVVTVTQRLEGTGDRMGNSVASGAMWPCHVDLSIVSPWRIEICYSFNPNAECFFN